MTPAVLVTTKATNFAVACSSNFNWPLRFVRGGLFHFRGGDHERRIARQIRKNRRNVTTGLNRYGFGGVGEV